MDLGTPSFTLGTTTSTGKTPKGKQRSSKPINHAAHAPLGSGIADKGQQAGLPQQGAAGFPVVGGSAFAELDANQQPLFNRTRFAAAASGKTAIAAASSGATASNSASGPAAAPEDGMRSWAQMLNSIQGRTYSSPGGAAAAAMFAKPEGGQAHHQQQQQQRQQGTAKPSRMQQVAQGFSFGSALPAAGGSPGGYFGVPAAAAGAATAAGAPPGTVPPGSAMSTDTAMPTFKGGATAAPFTAAFSAMSLDTPVMFGASTSSTAGRQDSLPLRGPRAAAVAGKRLFQTPSSAGGSADSPSGFTPSPMPFGAAPSPSSAGAAGDTGQAAAAGSEGSGTGRAAGWEVKFPDLGAAAGEANSPGVAGGLRFSLGECLQGLGLAQCHTPAASICFTTWLCLIAPGMSEGHHLQKVQHIIYLTGGGDFGVPMCRMLLLPTVWSVCFLLTLCRC